jgi:hypothetical protein
MALPLPLFDQFQKTNGNAICFSSGILRMAA